MAKGKAQAAGRRGAQAAGAGVRTLSIRAYDEQLPDGWDAASDAIRSADRSRMQVIGIRHGGDAGEGGPAEERAHYHIILRMLGRKRITAGEALSMLHVRFRAGIDDDLYHGCGVETIKGAQARLGEGGRDGFAVMAARLTHETARAAAEGKAPYDVGECVTNLTDDELEAVRGGHLRAAAEGRAKPDAGAKRPGRGARRKPGAPKASAGGAGNGGRALPREGRLPRVAVLIPCYNEEATVGKVVRDFREALPGAAVYVYDNNSTDRSAEEAAAAGAVVRREPAQGKGRVVRSMFRDIDAACYVMADADDTYPAGDAPALAAAVLEGGADMAVGDRLSSTYRAENKRPFHNAGNAAVRHAIRLLFGADVHDAMTGYRAFSFRFAKSFPASYGGFETETEMSAFAADAGMRLASMPVRYRDRPAGSPSKLRTVPDGARVLLAVARLFRSCRPMAYFSALGLLILAAAAAFFMPVLADYLKTGEVLRFPTLIACGFAATAALLSFCCGAVLSTLRRQDRQAAARWIHAAEWRMKDLAAMDAAEGAGDNSGDGADDGSAGQGGR